ncbi:hypothetical protein MKX07_007551 [Trichoderma sp. CBMAI-0711]|nr:hypothetical protein MKX07_007551 [Trichoderma sp. CBMAI-0711]
MTPPLQQLALAQHENDIRILHRRQPMRDNHHRPALAGPLKGRLDKLLALRVERASRLVEQQDVRVADERAGDGDALLLAARERDAAGANVGVVAFGEGDDEVVDGGVAAGLVYLLVGDGGFVDAEDDVVSKGACGKKRAE